MTADTTLRATPAPWTYLARAALVLVALWLGHQAWVRNLDEACRLNEWPYLQRCAEAQAQPPAAKAQALVERLRSNPGDSFAAVDLALLANAHPQEVPVDPAQALATARTMAPQNGQLLALTANQALAARDWPAAVPPLVTLAAYHRNTGAASTLGQLMGHAATDPALTAALMSATASTPDWLERTVRQMPGAKVPLVQAMPYVTAALETGRLDLPTSRYLIRQLKAEGQWLDAYTIWLYVWKRPVDLLFNGDFEQAFLPGGFDWEPGQTNAYRAGAMVQRSGRGGRGQVLQVVFTGKRMASYVVKQDVLLTPGRYVLEGQYQASALRSSQGLVWVVRCARDGREVGRTEAMVAESRNWHPFRLEFDFPLACGLGGRVELRPQAGFETVAGMKGEVLFDRLTLEKR